MRGLAVLGVLTAGFAMAPGSVLAQGAGSTALGYSGSNSGGMAGMGTGAGVFANPYTNPYVNPYAYSAYGNSVPRGGVGAAWMMMGMSQQAQQQAAAARSRGGRNAGDGGLTVPRGAMMRPGSGASRYFGGGTSNPDEDQTSNPGARSGYFSRHDRFFRPNG